MPALLLLGLAVLLGCVVLLVILMGVRSGPGRDQRPPPDQGGA